MRPNVDPSSNKKDTKNSPPFVFESFSRGVLQDPPASEISDALADGTNLTIFPGYYEGRTGCRLHTSTRFPFIEGRTGYTAHKVGNTIVSDSGNIFTRADIGNYWCWGSIYELIVDYVNASTVEVESSTYHDGNNCSIQGGLNSLQWHKSQREFVLQLGQEIYKASQAISSWEKLLTISRDMLFNVLSDYSEYKDCAYLFNGNGIFKAELYQGFPVAYKVNIPPPNIRILSRENFTGATCRYRYLYSAARLEREGNLISRQSPSRIACETGTCTPDAEQKDWGEVYTQSPISESHPWTVRVLWVPVVPNTNPVEYQWHLTHFPIWRTLNLEAKDTADTTKTQYNDPQRYIWDKDLRICAAFYVMIYGEIMVALRGEFELADTYSIIELDNGERYEIIEYINSVTVRIERDYYYGQPSHGPYAAAIGNGRVIRATVTGDILTRTHGGTFTAADERKTIVNSNGYRMYVTEYLDANRVRVHINNDLPVQGFTIDPTHRNYYDVITDEILRARKDFYSCYARYRQALPSCNLGKILPGFVVEAYRGQKEVYYSHIIDKMDWLIGQYIPTQVNEQIQDAIQLFYMFQDQMVIWCATSTWGFAIGLSEFTTLPESGEAIALLPGIKIIDKHIGCLDVGSVQEVESGVVQLITNEPGGEAMRQFNGQSYGENLLVDSLGGRIARLLEKTKRLSSAIYDGFMGYILWRKNK